MKYSIYVKNRIKRILLSKEPNLDKKILEQKANEIFNEVIKEKSYESALSKLDSDDPLKKCELEPVLHFSDLHYRALECRDVRVRKAHLYHGVRFDDDHKRFESILRDKEIKCGNKTADYYRSGGDNCNEGEYVSLIHYTGHDYDIEFETFVEENVSFIISPLLNPEKCKYLNYEEWDKIKTKLPFTKHRYSYAHGEYQVKDHVSLDYVVGILYPFNYYSHIKGYFKTKEDFRRIKELLAHYSYSYLPIFDPTDNFKDISKLGEEIFTINRPNFLK